MSAGSEPPARLKAVGFWRPPHGYPSPQWLVNHEWEAADRSQVVAYLRAGAVVASWLGYSSCRFCCGIEPRLVGSCDLTDGLWVWPEGLAHYVEKHHVALPDAIVHTMRANNWKMPTDLTERLPALVTNRAEGYDFEPWREWAFRFKPWYVLW